MLIVGGARRSSFDALAMLHEQLFDLGRHLGVGHEVALEVLPGQRGEHLPGDLAARRDDHLARLHVDDLHVELLAEQQAGELLEEFLVQLAEPFAVLGLDLLDLLHLIL